MTTIDLTWLCMPFVPLGLVGIPGAVMIVLITLSFRSRDRYIKRIQNAQERGAFADLNKPENKSRLRILGATALIGMFGAILSLAVLVLPWANKTNTLSWVIAMVAFIFGIISFAAGLLAQREIDRRL